MKTLFTSDSQRDEPMWMGLLVQPAPQPYRSTPPPSALPLNHPADSFDWLTQTPARPARPRPFERLIDAGLAVMFVTGCAAMGWAGAAWL